MRQLDSGCSDASMCSWTRNQYRPTPGRSDALQLGADAAAPNLHKAASYARRALGERGAVVLRGRVVKLAPTAEVTTVHLGDRADAARGGA